MPSQTDLDQGGTYRSKVRTDLGPSIGWTDLPGQTILQITAAGTYIIGPDTTLVTVNVAGAVTVRLPTTILPAVPAVTQPKLYGDVAITIVDIGGFAQANPITILPASIAETIMGLPSVQITSNYGSFTFNPTSPNLQTQVLSTSPLIVTGSWPRTQRSVTAGPTISIGAGDQILNVNISSGSPTCTLPLASTRQGLPLTFKDVGGQFAAHNLTLTPTSPDQIDGLASIVLNANRQALTLNPFNDGVNTGWFIT